MRSPRGVGLSVALAFVIAGGLTLAWTAGAQQTAPAQDPAAMFGRIATVLLNPRCENCHTITEFPRQGDDRHPHLFGVSRGADDKGLPWARCTTCHGTKNNDAIGVPGAEDWHLAPLSMEWEGLTVPQLCRRILDPAHNGNRTVAQIEDHMVNDQQFLTWAWEPGRNLTGAERQVPPMPRAEFTHLVQQWVAAGAPCPQ